MERKFFGTDGIRGFVGKDPITPEFVLKLGWAMGKVLNGDGQGRVVIGKDTRRSGYMLEFALASGLSAAGLKVFFTGPMPTPAVAYLTQAFRADAGIVISASHNPYHDNGIKFFSSKGTKLPDEIELLIEEELGKSLTCVLPEYTGKARRIDDAAGRYIELCKSTFPSDLSLVDCRVVVDCAHGATYHIAPKVLEELGAEVITIGCEPNGININDGVGATSTEKIQKEVIEKGADFGMALDGDGDRVIMVDEDGGLVDGDQIAYIIARNMKDRGKLRGGVVGTLMTNTAAELAFKKADIPFTRAKVGDRYVLEEMLKRKWLVGAENSGHVILLHKLSTGCGIIAGLQVMASVVANRASLKDLCQDVQLMPQHLENVHFEEGGTDPLDSDAVLRAKEEIENELKGAGRVLLRKSGTEPLIRVMVEAECYTRARDYALGMADAIKEAIKKRK